MCQQIAYLQNMASSILDIDIACTIKAYDFACSCTYNATCEINLTTTSIHILYNNLIGIGIIICIQLIFVATIIPIPVCSAIHYLISVIPLNCLIRNNRSLSIALIDFRNFRIYSFSLAIGNVRHIQIIVAIATLDNTIHINIGGIDINGATCNIAACSHFSMLRPSLFDVDISLAPTIFLHITKLRTIDTFNTATHANNAISVALGNATACG